ncbi:nuclease-related domain-containing protein [Asanoa sp. NPDC049518]|uniref:nuclease-related domain-containing protein n=1 Tax=unclassified Asanoa TaxID=2685164 RepID=UPI003437225F
MRVEMLSDHTAPCEPWLPSTSMAARQLWARVRTARSLWRRLLDAPPARDPAPPAEARADWQEVLLTGDRPPARATGVLGEDPLTAALGVLPDDWVMLRGYRNRRGGTDHVLVGPQGIWTVEVERRRIRLHAVGDQWWWEKLDARGHSVETGRAVDRAGRAMPRRVNDIADDLAAWLRRNRHDVPVRTAVVLTHEQARLGHCQDPTVSLVGTHPHHLLDALARYAAPLAACEVADLVRRDHHFHQRRRHRRA